MIKKKKEGAMKKIVVFLCSLVLFIGLSGVAGAALIQFTDITGFTATGTDPTTDYNSHGWGAVNKLDGLVDHVSWTHHFTFDQPVEELLSGTLKLFLVDNEKDVLWKPWTYELASGWAEDGSFDFGEVNTKAYSYDVNAAYLADGKFKVTLFSAGGDFFIEKSELSISYNASYNSVSEPATLLLMGAGFLGLAAAGRRKFNRN